MIVIIRFFKVNLACLKIICLGECPSKGRASQMPDGSWLSPWVQCRKCLNINLWKQVIYFFWAASSSCIVASVDVCCKVIFQQHGLLNIIDLLALQQKYVFDRLLPSCNTDCAYHDLYSWTCTIFFHWMMFCVL